jgi:hypothetical protein
MNEGAGGGEELSNQITESGGDTTLNKELIDMHQRPGKADSLTKAVLQLMAGDNINYDHGKAKLYISSLRTDDKITEAQEKTLTDTISTFFSERAPQDRANTIYMIFQPALENMFTTKIKQVPELQFFMAEVDMADFKYEPPKLKGIETELLKTISKLPQVKEEGTTELTSVNLCRKFGITLKTDLPLVHSITQMTGNILNIVYINDKIKNAIKTRSAPVSITNPVPKTHDELSQQLAAKSATLRKQAAKLEAAALTASEGKLPTLKSPSKPSNLRTGSVSTP